ncbi:peroxiredoxin [Flavobacterium algicola]|uniref:peroxiredoxin n=1 Tax=Flavobacterium algicola TaxID=556529 RepID=UPI001EFCF251|nr:peroxiredoxin [Flavobacterium algicola]MCG9793856.1 peroxiredoxin [Flavobacterium algicola]
MILKVGDKAPHFSSKDIHGKNFESQSIIEKKVLVLYFYPKNNTAICTAQACSFRDSYQDFQNLGADVIGVSSDDVASHQEFANKFKLPFLLLSDESQEIKKKYGVSSHFFGFLSNRITFVIDDDGIIQMIFDSVLGKNHISKALQKVKELINIKNNKT